MDEKNAEGTTIVGRLELSPIFKQFGINSGKKWSPQELGEFFKMNRSYFPIKETNMTLVATLRNFTAKVDADVEKQKDQKGSHSNLYRQTVTSKVSAGANEFSDEQVNKQIDSVIGSIIEIAPDIVIIYK